MNKKCWRHKNEGNLGTNCYIFSKGLVMHYHCIEFHRFLPYPCWHIPTSSRKDVLENFAKSTGNHLCRSLLLIGGSQICNFIKKDTPTHVFSCELWKILKNTFLQNTSRQLPLRFLKQQPGEAYLRPSQTCMSIWIVEIIH